MCIFNILKILAPHNYYHIIIIVSQSTYTRPQIRIITTFTKFHQCTYSPSRIFNYDTSHQIQVRVMF